MLFLLLRIPAILGLLMLLATFTPVVSWWGQWLSGPWEDSRDGTLIVLAADSVTMDQKLIGERSYWRASYAALAWRKKRFEKFFLSGDAAEPMRRFLIAEGVPESAIRLETRSVSTRENALFTTNALKSDPGPFTLLSSDFHMRRSLAAFREAGLKVRSEPMPDIAKRYGAYLSRWPAFLDLTVETGKLLWYKLRGWA